MDWTREQPVATGGKEKIPSWLNQYRSKVEPLYANAGLFYWMQGAGESYPAPTFSTSIIPLKLRPSQFETSADIAEDVENESFRVSSSGGLGFEGIHTNGKTQYRYYTRKTIDKPTKIFEVVEKITSVGTATGSTTASQLVKTVNSVIKSATDKDFLTLNQADQTAYEYGMYRLDQLSAQTPPRVTKARYDQIKRALNPVGVRISAKEEKAIAKERSEAEETKKTEKIAQRRADNAKRRVWPNGIDPTLEFSENYTQVIVHLRKELKPFADWAPHLEGAVHFPDVAYVGLKSCCLWFEFDTLSHGKYSWEDPGLLSKFNGSAQRRFLFGTFARYTSEIILIDRVVHQAAPKENTYFNPEFGMDRAKLSKLWSYTEPSRLKAWAETTSAENIRGTTDFLKTIEEMPNTFIWVGSTRKGTFKETLQLKFYERGFRSD